MALQTRRTRVKIDNWPFEFPGAYWLDAKEQQAATDVLRNGSLFRYYGLNKPRYVDRFEEAAKKFYGMKYALGLNSGTGALSSCMAALGVGPGDEVIVPAYMWVATVGAVVQANAIPVLCEIDDSFNMDPWDLSKKITKRTKLIIPIHMSGAACNMKAVMAVANKHNIPVLEDCAQCNGGSFGGEKVGTFGRMSIFSLQLNKNMTCGEGGLLLTNDEKLFHRAFSAHDMGMVRVAGRLATPEPYAVAWGQGRRMTEICGAIALAQLAKLPKIVKAMLASKKRIKAMLEDIEGLNFRRIHDEDGDSGAFLLLVLDSEERAVSAAAKMKEMGLHNIVRVADFGLHVYYNIPALVGRVPLSPAGNPWKLPQNVPLVRDYNKGACPRSDDLMARGILIPIPSCLTRKQEKDAAAVIRAAVE
jgi:8-amino-3,8-dideoxy-alpha-D-manno-octulosonate transaminase